MLLICGFVCLGLAVICMRVTVYYDEHPGQNWVSLPWPLWGFASIFLIVIGFVLIFLQILK